MVVLSVTAKINGHMFSCTNTEGDIWSVRAPSDCPDGSYTCEFWATDDSGNVSYKTAILWIFDGRLTCIKWLEDKFNIKYLSRDFSVNLIEVGFSTSFRDTVYSALMLPFEFTCHYLRSMDDVYNVNYMNPEFSTVIKDTVFSEQLVDVDFTVKVREITYSARIKVSEYSCHYIKQECPLND